MTIVIVLLIITVLIGLMVGPAKHTASKAYHQQPKRKNADPFEQMLQARMRGADYNIRYNSEETK